MWLYIQQSFWVWAEPMRVDIIMQCHLSLAEPIHRMIHYLQEYNYFTGLIFPLPGLVTAGWSTSNHGLVSWESRRVNWRKMLNDENEGQSEATVFGSQLDAVGVSCNRHMFLPKSKLLHYFCSRLLATHNQTSHLLASVTHAKVQESNICTAGELVWV